MILPFGTPDRLLRHFCRTGDPRALGLLFDRTAAELLRAAVWLCGNRTDAEDLLQRTFLSVIESRQRFDPTQRALPWLIGILGNHARKLQDKRRRDLDRAQTEAAAAAGEPDPATAAASAEFVAMVESMRRSIGAPYGELLDLHLGKGMLPGEIAAVLGRSPGTVRTQLMRGLALLRQRLPMHLIGPMGAWLVLSQSATAARLAPMRTTLVEAASAGAPVAAATLLGKPLAALVAAAVCVCLGAAAVWFHSGTMASAMPTTGPTAADRAETTSAAPMPTGSKALAAAPGETDRELATAATTPPDTPLAVGIVRGQVVDGAGQPVAGARLWMSLATDATEGSEVGVADAQGRFELQFEGARLLGAVHEGHVDSFLRVLRRGRTQEITLRLRGPSGRVAGRVFGADGEPLAGAAVEIGLPGGWQTSNAPSEQLTSPPSRRATTDRRGEFEVDGIEPGPTRLSVRATGHGPHRGEVLAERYRGNPVVIRLRRGATVAGTVYDDARQAVAAARIVAEVDGGAPLYGASDDAGHFALTDLATGTLRLRAELGERSVATAFELAPGATVTWDPILVPTQRLAGLVVDRSGRPLDAVQVQLGNRTSQAAAPEAVTGIDGAFALPIAGDGPFELLVLHDGAPLAVRGQIRPQTRPVVVSLTDAELPTATIAGHIVDRGAGAVAAAVTVQSHSFQTTWTVRTDPATGRFRVGPLAAGSYTLVVEAPGRGRTPLRVLELRAGESRQLEALTLDAAGRVDVALVGDDAQRRRVVKFTRDDGTVVAHAMTEGAAVNAELPPGRYTASVFLWENAGSATTVEVRRGETTRCALPCVATAPVALRVAGLRPSAHGLRIDVLIRDAGGNFLDAYELTAGIDAVASTTIGLPPGTYRIECRTTTGETAAAELQVQSPRDRPQLTLTVH